MIGSVLLTIILMNFIAAIHEDFTEADFHCLVVDKTECTEEDEHIVMRLNETENSHGEVNESDNYDKVVCCASSAVFLAVLGPREVWVSHRHRRVVHRKHPHPDRGGVRPRWGGIVRDGVAESVCAVKVGAGGVRDGVRFAVQHGAAAVSCGRRHGHDAQGFSRLVHRVVVQHGNLDGYVFVGRAAVSDRRR